MTDQTPPQVGTTPIPWYRSVEMRYGVAGAIAGLLMILKALTYCPKIFGTPICEWDVDKATNGVLGAGAILTAAHVIYHRIKKGKDPTKTDAPIAIPARAAVETVQRLTGSIPKPPQS